MKLLILITLLTGWNYSTKSFGSSLDLIGENLHPEGIAYREKTSTLYIGSANGGSIQKMVAGVPSIIQPAGTDKRLKTLGMKVDEKHGRLWVLDGKAVYIYDLDTNELIKKISLSSILKVKDSALNDLAINSDGDAFITDSFNAHIIKVHGKSLRMSVAKNLPSIPFGNQNDLPYNLNGIVLIEDESVLLAVKTNDGALWRIGLEDGKVFQLKLSESVDKGDGLVIGKNHLYIIQNFVNKISKIRMPFKFLEDEVYKVEKVKASPLDIPTTAVYIENSDALVIVNSQFGKNKPSHPFKLTHQKLNLKKKETKMKKILMVLTSNDQLGSTGRKTGSYLPEVTHPYYAFLENGYQVEIASIKGGVAPLDPGSLDKSDRENKNFLEDKAIMSAVNNSFALSQLKAADYDAIFFAGGMGTMWDFAGDSNIQSLTAGIYENGGVVSAVCHGPAALTEVRLSNGKFLIDGKKLTGFSNAEEDISGTSKAVPYLLETRLIERKGEYTKSSPWSEYTQVDGRLVTGQNPS
jgi:putative intracellular protease/amidase